MSSNIQPELPRWLRDFSRYLPLKSMFLLHGNIYDLLMYPVQTEDAVDGKYKWSYFSLRQLLHLFLRERGYNAVAYFDSVDGISFFEQHEQRLFESAARGRVLRDRQSSSDSPPASGINQQASNAAEEPGSESEQLRSSGQSPSLFSRLRDFDSALGAIRRVLEESQEPVAVVIDHSSRLITSPEHLSGDERRQFIHLLKCLHNASVRTGGRNMNHALILVCDNLSDLPSWLYLNNPRVKPLQIDLPDESERRRYFEMAEKAFFENTDSHQQENDKPGQYLQTAVELTRGLRNYELECLREISMQEKMPLTKSKKLVENYKFGVKENAWDRLLKGDGREKLINAEKILGDRVKGQDPAINAVVDIIKRAASGLSGIHHSASAHKPKGILFFAGPTGVGKTELAKALAELLFSDENSIIRFDMSEYAQEHSDQKLFGAPPGYVGYGQGGQLTNKVKDTPFAVLLFDEIEKAHPKIMDKFLQILEDGRMTDSKGETVFFSESVIIFTSNIGAYVDVPAGAGSTFVRRANILPHSWRCKKCQNVYMELDSPDACSCGCTDLVQQETPYRVVKKKVLGAVEEHFKEKLGRPEIYNRIGNNFVVFDYIRPTVIYQIMDKVLEKNIRRELLEKKETEINYSDEVRNYLLEKAAGKIQEGGRGIGNLVETVLVNPLARIVFDEQLERTTVTIKKIKEKQVGEDIIYELELG